MCELFYYQRKYNFLLKQLTEDVVNECNEQKKYDCFFC